MKTALLLLIILTGCKDKPAPTVSLQFYMPKFEIRTNSHSDYRVAFKPYDSTNWCVVDIPFASHDEAEKVIAESQIRLEATFQRMTNSAPKSKR